MRTRGYRHGTLLIASNVNLKSCTFNQRQSTSDHSGFLSPIKLVSVHCRPGWAVEKRWRAAGVVGPASIVEAS